MNWGYDLAEGKLRKRFDVGIVQASTLENKALAQDTIDRLLSGFDDRTRKAYVLGLFVNLAEGLVYYSFDRSDNVVRFPRIPPDARIGAGMDFNVDPMAATVFWYRMRPRPHIHFFDEIELQNSDTEEMCKVLKERYWNHGLRQIFPDSNVGRHTNAPGGKTDYNWIEEAGFEVMNLPEGNPHRRDRWNSVNRMLRSSKGVVACTFDPSCDRLIKNQMLYSHELMQRDEQKKMSHLLDARDYPLYHLFPFDRNPASYRRIRGV